MESGVIKYAVRPAGIEFKPAETRQNFDHLINEVVGVLVGPFHGRQGALGIIIHVRSRPEQYQMNTLHGDFLQSIICVPKWTQC